MAPRLLFVVTHPLTARYLLRGQLAFFSRQGYEVMLACAPGAGLDEVAEREGVQVVTVPMAREIAPVSDLRTLVALDRLIGRFRPEVVWASTPKAGLLAGLAARRRRVPVRLYTLRGLRLETARGWRRWLLRRAERLAIGSARRVVVVSESLRERAVELGLVAAEKTVVVGAGSSNGVDAGRFFEAAARERASGALRAELGIEPDARVVGFVGRLVRDKGIVELAEAWARVREAVPDARLLLLGDFEEGDPVPAEISSTLRDDPSVCLAGWVEDVAPYYGVMDVLAFPSYREGFPNAPLEAAAAGVPAVAFAATGTVDAVLDGETGTLLPVGDADRLAEALVELLADPGRRARLGEAARRRVAEQFGPEEVWCGLAEVLEEELEGRRRPRPADPLKRAFDLVLATTALVVLSPLLAVLALLVRARLGSPVLFRQVRPGLGGRPFELLKLRTMTGARGADGELLPDAERLTGLGRFLRRTSLDELPELLNVIRGEMSLVGPRPLLMEYLERYTPEQARRHEVPPGITGWAQVNGRNALSWEEKFAYDVWYVDHRSLWLDLKILLRTLWQVVRGDGIHAAGHASMPVFEGSSPMSDQVAEDRQQGR